MNKITRSSLALIMVLVMLFAFVPTLQITTSAASSASDVSYVYDSTDKYIYNWGERGEVATFLSPNAEDFYTGSNTYASLSSYSGGTSTSTAPNSALYKALQSLMKDSHSHQTSYNETKNLYKYTDCQNSGGKISSFYSGKGIGPSWDGGWNREHTWPNSKGLGGNDENDIMMLRPTSTSENSSRGNTAYGKSSGYYNPNSESGGAYDLRGDVARIFLYVYVRWGNVNGNGSYSTWGTRGVMESLDVLLEWMEADPVDTWELGRNDSVESITGTRNVFVDYPEFAFLLFGEDIPADMETPSGGAENGKCDHNNFGSGVVIAATCTTKGYTIFTCKTAGCGYSYQANATPAKGHSYSSGICTSCGEAEPVAPVRPEYAKEIATGKAYKLGIFSTDKNAEYYFTGSMNGYYGSTDTDYTKGVDVYAESVSGGYRLYFNNASGQKQYINLVVSGTHRNFTYSSTATSTFTWDEQKHAFYTNLSGDDCYIGTYGSYVTMGVLQSSKMQSTDYIARLYDMGTSSGGGDTSCQHNYASAVTAPTCTKDGFTTYTCTLCNDTYTGNKVIATGHNYSGNKCTACGATKPSESSLTISFADTANRTEFTKTVQVWEQNGIKVTNNKAGSNVDVADYKDPARFYKGSDVIISCPDMIKMEIDCTGLESKYVGGWLNVTGATVTNNGGIVTVVFDSPIDEFTYTNLSAQSRAKSITIYVESGSGCAHTNTSVEGAIEATCTKDGHSGTTVCLDCNEIIDNGRVIPTEGHSYDEWRVIISSSCTRAGMERRDCDDCISYETREIDPLGHEDDDGDGICDTCFETAANDDPSGDANTGKGTFMDTIMKLIENIINAINDFIKSIFSK